MLAGNYSGTWISCSTFPAKSLSSQEVFQLEAPFEHPVKLPPEILQVLRTDEENEQRFDSCSERKKQKEIPAKWFVASEVRLRHDERPGIVVKAENGCLWGANIGPFWVFRHKNQRYQLVLTDEALGLELLPTTANGFPDVRISASLAGVVVSREYKFNEEKYELASKRIEPSPMAAPH